MSGANGNRRMQGELAEKFVQTFNIYHLYQFCYKIYKKKEGELHRKYANLFSCIHLINTRSVLQQKESLFIRQWRDVLAARRDDNYLPHAQELVKLLEIIDERLKQASLFITFLNDLTRTAWKKLEGVIVGELQALRSSVVAVLQGILRRDQAKINCQVKNRIKFIIEAPQLPESESPPEQRQAPKIENLGRQNDSPHLRSQQNSKGPYQVSSIKFFVKERPAPVRLLSKEEVETLRREIIERKKSSTIITEGSVREKESDKATDYKQKSQNYNTYHTEISENSDESSSSEGKLQMRNSNSLQKVKRNGKLAFGKHHKSNFEDSRNLKKMLEVKDGAHKSNSIHKIEGINAVVRYHKSIEEPPSRNTIETSSINRFLIENPAAESIAKKPRMNKISIIGKLERTIKKIQIKNLKKPRGGMYITDDKLREIDEIYRSVKQTEGEEKLSNSKSEEDSLNESNSSGSQGEKFNEKLIKQDKRISEFIECSSQKEHQKYKRRLGVSSKAVNSNKSIDWYSIQAKNLAEKHKYSDLVSRTSIFRSSGSNFEEKKSVSKSKYNQHFESHKRVKLGKAQNQCYEERDSKQFEQMAKQFALSKKSNQKINQQNIFNVHRDALVSSHEMVQVLTQIHEQDKFDRSSKYEDYYDEVLRRKYEGQSRNSNQDGYDKVPASFKIENGVEERPSIKLRNLKEGSLFEFMLKTVKFTQQLELEQIGGETTYQ